MKGRLQGMQGILQYKQVILHRGGRLLSLEGHDYCALSDMITVVDGQIRDGIGIINNIAAISAVNFPLSKKLKCRTRGLLRIGNAF